MFKKLLSSLLAVLLLLSCCTVAMAADDTPDFQIKTLETTIDSITVGIDICEGAAVKNSKLVFIYPEDLTLISAEATLPEEEGITDLDTSKAGTISFAWASVEAQGETRLLVLKFRGTCGNFYPVVLSLPEQGDATGVNLQIPYRFIDVQDASKWYFAPIYQVYEAGLMNGVGQNLFAPNKTLNRATLVTVLYRMAGSPAVQGSGSFSDVPDNSWYTEAVTWAEQNGIAKGYGQGIFAPGRAITRQEMVTMVFRFWQLQNQATAEVHVDLSAFRDQDQVADWAKEAMNWAVTSGVIQGMSTEILAPKGTATRAQAAQVLVNYQLIL